MEWLGQQLADQPKFFPTIHFRSTIHFQLQFTCTWSGPKYNIRQKYIPQYICVNLCKYRLKYNEIKLTIELLVICSQSTSICIYTILGTQECMKHTRVCITTLKKRRRFLDHYTSCFKVLTLTSLLLTLQK